MKRKPLLDPYLKVIKQFNRLGVRYVVVGMSGINYYARDPRQTFGTLDFDLFLEPTLTNVKKAIPALKRLGYHVAGEREEVLEEELKGIVRIRQTLTATTAYGEMIELLLEISGFPFTELARDAATFTVEGVGVRVGSLEKLLRSKKLAGRPKDAAFLKRYEALLEEEGIEEE
ncbi:MAG: hypothetical protein HYU34_04715 [Candidatus Omnitrophica bacterium]|nr:hypothetical protein [Candidatus Omnitrophota bacterium]